MRVVVTGAAGLIGGIVIDDLVSAGHEVVGVDRPHEDWVASGRNSADANAPGRVNLHIDLAQADDDLLASMLGGCEVLIHLAADANPGNDDDSMLRNNVQVTTMLFRAARESAVRRVVIASSGLAQVGLEPLFAPGGPFEGEMIGVSHGVAPDSLYGISKIFAEQLAEMHSRIHGIETIAVRLGTVIAEESEHWIRGGRLQATAFLATDAASFFRRCVETDLDPNGERDKSGSGAVHLLTAAQSDPPGRFVDLEPGLSILGWAPIPWPDAPPG